MAATAVIALDLWIVRQGFLWADHRIAVLVGLGPALLVFSIVLIKLSKRRPTDAAAAWYWAGFLLAGAFAAAWVAAPLLRDPQWARKQMQDHMLMLEHYVGRPFGLMIGPGNVLGIGLMIVVAVVFFCAIYSGPVLGLAYAGGKAARGVSRMVDGRAKPTAVAQPIEPI